MHRVCLAFVLAAFLLPGPAPAQDTETLADIRQELSVLHVELQRLKRELSTTGSVGELSTGGSIPERVDAIEGEVQRLTELTEQLEFRIDRVVRDGTNRLGDLEFRLCELEAGCDISDLSEGTTLGGVEPERDSAPSPEDEAEGDGEEADAPQMAVGEEAAFEAARDTLEDERFSEAAEAFERFRENYPGGPLSDQARLLQGEALEGAGETTRAARAYLDLFSTAPEGPLAPDALFRLGRALGELDKSDEACVTLGEVESRFPGAGVVPDARQAMRDLGCQ